MPRLNGPSHALLSSACAPWSTDSVVQAELSQPIASRRPAAGLFGARVSEFAF